MSLADIKNNIDKFDRLEKEKLIEYIHELLILEKRRESKILSLQAEIKYLTRHMKKIKELMEKVLTTREEENTRWKTQ